MKDFVGASLAVITVLFLIACSVFWFNIKKSSSTPNRGFWQMVASENQGDRKPAFKLTDKLFFDIRKDSASDKLVMHLIDTYERNVIPYCFVCGWNVNASGFFMMKPHKKDEYYYSGETSFKWDGKDYNRNDEVYYVLDSKTWEVSFVKTVEELNAKGLLLDDRYRVRFTEDELKNYKLLSMESGDSCMIILSAFFFLYIMLIPTYIVLVIKGRMKKKAV